MKIPPAISAASREIRRILDSAALPWLVLAVGIPITILLFVSFQHSIDDLARVRFERQANDANGIIQNRLRSHTDVLYALRALFSGNVPIDRRRFHSFVESLDLKHRYPGFDALNFAEYVPEEKRTEFEEAVRHDTSFDPRGYPGFRIKPPGRRPEYYVIVYLEPMAGYEFAFGLDISANPAAVNPENILSALRSARDSGELTASGQPLRVNHGKESVFLAIRLAVYRYGQKSDTVEERRAGYFGSVGAGINVEDLMRGVLDEGMLRNARIRLYDAGAAARRVQSNASGGMQLLFDSNQLLKASLGKSGPIESSAMFVQVLPVEIAGRIWNFQYSTPKDVMIGRLDRTWPWFFLFGGVLSTVLLAGVLYSLSTSRSHAVRLAAQITGEFRESEDRLRAVSGRLVEVQEAERRLLATELHDRVGQNLTALGLNLRLVAGGGSGSVKPEAVARLQDCEVLLKATVDAIRNVMGELRPQVLDDYGLLAALRSHASGFSKRTGIPVSIDGGGVPGGLPKSVDVAMFRIAQEALNNVAKHSKANRVEIALLRANGHARLSIRDDGVGFDPKRVEASNPDAGWGLLIMRERAEAVGAKLKLDANPGSGVRVVVEYRI